jgi:hypothetical protein
MNYMKTLRVTVIICILLVGSFLPMFEIVQTGKANPGDAEKTLYFVNKFDNETETDPNFGIALVSESPPTNSDDLFYPPDILNIASLSEEELVEWITSWAIYLYGTEAMGEFSDLGDLGQYEDLIDLALLFLPHPFRIIESYVNKGDESLQIDGNINFRLYFSSPIGARISNFDTVEVAIYTINELFFLPTLKAQSNATIKTNNLFSDNSVINIELDKVNLSIMPGSTILFEIELIPSNKTITNIIKKPRPLIENTTTWIFNSIMGLMENSGVPSFESISDFYNEIQNISEQANISFSKEDIAQIVNSMISSSFVYGSNRHPSSVTLPLKTSLSDEENYKNYYLKSDNSMSENKPVSENSQTINLATTVYNWSSPEFERSKILKQATAELYIDYQDFNLLNPLKEPIEVIATLFDGSTQIDSYAITLDRTALSEYLEPKEPVEMYFPFSNLSNYEIRYGTKLDLNLKVKEGTKFGLISNQPTGHRYIKLYYDSINYPSSLKLEFSDTDHIKMNVDANPSNEKLVPEGFVRYYLNISSYEEQDTISVEMPLSYDTSKWDVEIDPMQITVDKDTTETVNVTVSAKDTAEDNDKIDLKLVAGGKTGIAIYETSVEVSEDAVEYEIGLISPTKYRTIKHGENGSYFFKITNKNTGIWPDNYEIEVTSEHDWNLTYKKNIFGLMPEETKEIEVKVFIPKYTNISSDELIFEVSSKNGGISESATVITNVTGPDIIESIYHFFEILAEDIGFVEYFGDFAPHALAAIFIAIAFFVIIIIVFLLTIKNVNIICLDRIKEIAPAQSARFDIILRNPTKRPKTYLINANPHSIPANWDIYVDPNRVIVNPGQTVPLSLLVHPTKRVSENEWIEVDITVKIEGKKKREKITTMTMLKEAISPLNIEEVYHYPKNFGEGEKVTTSFKLKNSGNIDSKKVTVSILVNDEQKNKVEDIIIPAGGYADIRMPWIAVKGKNEIDIVVE